MGQKRHLGLGKAAKAKKLKKESSKDADQNKEVQQSNEITVELSEEADANDEIAQLRALWNTHSKSEKDNELVLNGIIHECDRLLRNTKVGDDGKIDLPDVFHSIYAFALADLALFQTEDMEKVKEFMNAALERTALGLEAHPGSVRMLFTECKILVNRIPLQYVSQMDIESKVSDDFPQVQKLLDKALETYESAETKSESLQQFECFDENTLEILEALDDLLDMIDNFGKEKMEGESSDNEAEEDEEEEVKLSKKHPLYGIRESDKYNQWWRDHIIKFLGYVDKELKKQGIDHKKDQDSNTPLLSLRREICKRIGQSYLQEAEIPSSVFTSLSYDDSYSGIEELHGLTRLEAQKISQDLFQEALKYLKESEDKEEPESWVNIAEAMISLANLYDLDSEDQEKLYKKAEKILERANKVTHGKYDEVLENLLG